MVPGVAVQCAGEAGVGSSIVGRVEGVFDALRGDNGNGGKGCGVECCSERVVGRLLTVGNGSGFGVNGGGRKEWNRI